MWATELPLSHRTQQTAWPLLGVDLQSRGQNRQREAQSDGRPALQSRLAAIPQIEIAAQPPGETITHSPGGFRQKSRSQGKHCAQRSVARASWLIHFSQSGPICSQIPKKYVALGKIAGAFACQPSGPRTEEHTSELQSLRHLVCRLLLEK